MTAEKTKFEIISGKRKTSVAKVRIKKGTGKITINKLPYTELSLFHKLAIAEPIKIYEVEMGEPVGYDMDVRIAGGGRQSQIQAARLAIAKALVYLTSSDTLKKAYLKYDHHLLIQDPRRKETRKPGDSKARASRQKSYR